MRKIILISYENYSNDDYVIVLCREYYWVRLFYASLFDLKENFYFFIQLSHFLMRDSSRNITRLMSIGHPSFDFNKSMKKNLFVFFLS